MISLRRPEEILAYRPVQKILQGKPAVVWSGSPTDSIFTAVTLMNQRNIGFLVVLEGGELRGVLSERDCARRVTLSERSPHEVQVSEIMSVNVASAKPTDTFADCLRIMHDRRVRHLPVLEEHKVVGVISIRDMLAEAVAHHARIITELELERLTMLTSAV